MASTKDNPIGARLRKLRVRRKLSQAELAARTGIVQNLISKHERGDRTPNLESMKKYAAEFGTTVGRLYEGG